jgi:neutral ceramidase
MKFLSFLCGFVISLAVAQGAESGWQAGFAKAPITPSQPMWMSGYAGRTAPADGTETDLWAKAAVFQDAQGQRAVLVTLDLVGIDRELSQEICRQIMAKHRLPRQALVLANSHTHCGPVVGKTLRSMYFLDDEHSRRVDQYTQELPGKILKVVDQAINRLEPVRLYAATGRASFAVNRRNNKEAEIPALRAAGVPLKGPIDHDVPVLAARNSAGTWTGIVFGYACHATTLAFQKWCGDYPGYAMLDLEAANPDAVALFFAGCGADQNPLPRRTVELAKNYGRQLADAVSAVLAKPMTELSPQFIAAYQEIPLPLSHIPNREELLKQTESKNKYEVARAKLLLKKLETASDLPTNYPYPVQTWRFGGQTLVILGGEVVVDYSLRLKNELGPQTWVMAYANDVMAYIPSLRVLNEGGYEGATSMLYYGLPSPWGPKVEDLIIAEARRQFKHTQR